MNIDTHSLNQATYLTSTPACLVTTRVPIARKRLLESLMSFDDPTSIKIFTCADFLADVSGLYGQGAVACWLLTLCSVVVSWTFNRDCRVRDEITNDFVAAIAMPCVSAGHLIYQIIRRPSWLAIEADNSLFWGAHKMAARIRASHRVCATYAIWSLLLM
jgi:hypothetical protein